MAVTLVACRCIGHIKTHRGVFEYVMLAQPSRAEQGRHPYVFVGHSFINERMPLCRVWRLLWTQQIEFLGSEGKTHRPGDALRDRLPPWVLRGWRATVGTWRFARARRDDGRRLVLPVDGEIAIERRSGAVKVLQHDLGQVATIMPPRSAEKLRIRLSNSRSVEDFPFAPRVRAIDLENGWFAEEFVRGVHPTAFRGCRDGFEEVYLPLLIAMLRAQEPTWRPIGEYASELVRDITSPAGLLALMPDTARDDVTTFVQAVRARLTVAPDNAQRMPLVLSHGDFFSGNVVIPAQGPAMAIDWAHVGRRSPLHDLHYVVMNHCFKVLPEGQLRLRLKRLIDGLRTRLATEDPDRFRQLEPALTARHEQRLVFYLECIQVPLVSCEDPDDRYLRAMLARVEQFRAYEATVAGAG